MKKSEFIVFTRVAGLYTLVSTLIMALEELDHDDIPNDIYDNLQLIIPRLKDLEELTGNYCKKKVEAQA